MEVAITNLVHQTSKTMNDIYRLMLHRISKRTGIISLSTAVTLTVLYSLYQKLFKAPKQFRHLPYINPFYYYKNALGNKLFEDYSKAIVMPLLEQGSNGIYMVNINKQTNKKDDYNTIILF